MKKVLFGLITLALVIGTFLGCANSSNVASSQGVSAQSIYSQESTAQSVFSQTVSSLSVSSQTILPPSANETFFFANNMFLGSYRDGAWRKSDFTVSEVLAHSYQLYKQDGTTEKVTSGSMYIGNMNTGDGCISLKDARLLYPFTIGTDKNNNDFYYFNFPTILTGAAAKVLMNDYNARITLGDESFPLATNSKFNPVPRPVKTDVTSDDNMKKAVSDTLDNLGIPGAPVNIMQVYRCDIKGDGTTQQVIIAYTPIGKEGYPLVSAEELKNNNSGCYSMCIVIVGANVKIIQEHHIHYDYANEKNHFDLVSGTYASDAISKMILLGCFDLNHDGKYEILIDDIGWEWGSDRVYAVNNQNTWTEVLTSDYGM